MGFNRLKIIHLFSKGEYPSSDSSFFCVCMLTCFFFFSVELGSSQKSSNEVKIEAEPPVLDCLPQSSPDDSDATAMPQLELQNSVFDGGGAEGRDVLPHLTPQLWPPSNSVAYRRHFGGALEQQQPQATTTQEAAPPPLLLGGKTMVWTSRTPPSSTVTSPTPKKTTPKLQNTPSSSPFEVSCFFVSLP